LIEGANVATLDLHVGAEIHPLEPERDEVRDVTERRKDFDGKRSARGIADRVLRGTSHWRDVFDLDCDRSGQEYASAVNAGQAETPGVGKIEFR
jgi:hypothetical protein